MRLTSTRLKVAYVALAAVDARLAGAERPLARRARLLTKPLLMPTLAGSLALDARARTSPLRTSTLVAQAGGWLGDLALMRPGREAFMAGAGAFAVGHVAYVAGFRRLGRPLVAAPAARGPRAVAAAWLLSAPVLAALAAREEKRLGGAVLGYSAVLAAMAASAQHLGPDVPRDARALTAAGATLFMASDTVLAVREFAAPGADPRMESLVMATYTGAQLLLSEGAARAGR